MVTYIRFRINSTIREKFLKDYITSITLLNRNEYCADCRISECISESENIIIQLDWIDHNLKDDPLVLDFKRLVENYKDFILEMRNYKDLTLSDIP